MGARAMVKLHECDAASLVEWQIERAGCSLTGVRDKITHTRKCEGMSPAFTSRCQRAVSDENLFIGRRRASCAQPDTRILEPLSELIPLSRIQGLEFAAQSSKLSRHAARLRRTGASRLAGSPLSWRA